MAGSIALSLTQRYDKSSHVPLNGGLLYFYAAGTTTPQSAYQDISLTIPWPNPITLDSGGNVPQLFFADGYVKFRLANSAGVTQIEADFVLVLGPTSGGGAAPSVDPTTILQTGWLQPIYGTGAVTGFVRANGRTIGSASSGASERANADTVALFSFLYGQDANLAVSGGRGVSAAADYAANKTIALPDWRGRAMAFLDDMGNSAAGRLTSTYFGTAATVLGAAGGAEKETLAAGQIPTITSVNAAQSITVTAAGNIPIANSGWSQNATGSGSNTGPFTSGSVGNQVAAISGNNSISVNYTNASPTPVVTMQPTMLATIYLKL